MKCCDCGKEMRWLSGYTLTDQNVGVIETDGEYWECTNPDCGCKLVPAATVHKVDVIRAERTKKMLWSLLGSPEDLERLFIRVKEVAAILGVTRQAVEKSPFVKGLTYNIVIMGIRYWLKESVELYKKTGNGKFPLMATEDIEKPNEIFLEKTEIEQKEYIARYDGDISATEEETKQLAKQVSDNTTGKVRKTWKSKLAKKQSSNRKYSPNPEQFQSSSIFSTSQETQIIQYLISQHVTNSTASI